MNQKKKNDTLKRSMEEAMEKAKEAEYQSLADGLKPKTPYLRNMLWAFLTGGFICVIGQAILEILLAAGMIKQEAITVTLVIIIFFGSLLTGLGVMTKLGSMLVRDRLYPLAVLQTLWFLLPWNGGKRDSLVVWQPNVYIGRACDCLWYLRFYCIGANKVSLAPYNRRSLMNQKTEVLSLSRPVYIWGGRYCRAKEKKGPLGDDFDKALEHLGPAKDSWENSEIEMTVEAVTTALNKAKISAEDLDLFCGGDLLNQICAAISLPEN